MVWQLVMVGVLVAGAAGYVARQTWRTWFGSAGKGCRGGCGCAGKSASAKNEADLIPVTDLTARLRHRSR